MDNTFPKDFDWNQYMILNHYFFTNSSTKEDVEKHYLTIGKENSLSYQINKICTIIYSGGKTGSTSLFLSFIKMGKRNSTFVVHSDVNLFFGMTIRDIINCSNNNILIISVYREPISRHISSFFQNIIMHMNMPVDDILKLDKSIIIDKVINFLGKFWECYHPFLENNKKNFFDINIFEKPFDKTNGFQTYEKDRVRILMLRFDKITKWENIIIENTEHKDFELVPENLTSEKIIYSLYKIICNDIIIPKNILNKMFEKEKRNLEYFYTESEIQEIKRKWTK